MPAHPAFLRILATSIALALISVFPVPSLAAEPTAASTAAAKPDLSTPAKAAESFFKAAKARDLAALKLIISPRIQESITKGGKTLEDFAKIWDDEVDFISAAEPLAADLSAGNRVGVPVTMKNKKSGKQETGGVKFVKSGSDWLLDER